MRYLCLFSGISAPSVAWKPLGWEPVGFAEIDPFPCAVLSHRFPGVPNFGDVTTIQVQPGSADVVVGGSPCQSFSLAGKRLGLDDPRGNLTLEFLRIAERLKPEWIVWENVPGIISDKTGAITSFLDGLEELKYVVDIDIMDAQYFGVPQRRRRVFVCGQLASAILTQKTISSGLTVAQCLIESLLLGLAVLSDQLSLDSESCGFDVSQPAHSLKRRMTLFGLDSVGAAASLADALTAILPSSEQGPSDLDSDSGNENSANTEGTKSPGSTATTDRPVAECPSIASSWKNISVDALRMLNECITSISTNETIESKIFTFAQTTLLTCSLITPSMQSSPSYWSAAASSLTTLKGFIDYARQASNSFFTGMEWIQPWRDFLRQAVRAHDAIASIGIRNFGQVLPISYSLSGNPPPGRKAGSVVTSALTRSLGSGGADAARAQANHLTTFDVSPPLTSNPYGDHKSREGLLVTEANSTRPRAVARPLIASMRRLDADTEELIVAYARQGSNANGGRKEVRGVSAVRRLTPRIRECERLQGFPEDWSLVPYRGKPAADSPRYKAIGNSMAVPVVRWIGERIDQLIKAN